jgi:phosphoribosylformylglycinamidine cyclo-ligase
MTERLSYAATGVDIDATDAVKRRMADAVNRGDPRVLNQLGAFAPLVQGTFPDMDEPLLVIKTDEPGSKQKLAVELDRMEDLSHDLVNHTVNDVVMMGAHPMYVTDCIVCGTLDRDLVPRLVTGMADACQKQGCVLIGGETSVQPGVVTDGLFVLSATVVGVVDRAKVVDGSKIAAGDVVLGVASNGLHTNGYTLVRTQLERRPAFGEMDLQGERLLDVIMRPHTGYYPALREILSDDSLHGLAHITGGGIVDNLQRVVAGAVDAIVDLCSLRVPPVFKAISEEGNVEDDDMLRTFNLGVGLTMVCAADAVDRLASHVAASGLEVWQIGTITVGSGKVQLTGTVDWS